METSASDPPSPASFGVLLKRFRRAAGLSQEALAERARLSARAISAYERGQRRAPYRETVALLVQALGLTPEAAALLQAAVPRRRGPPTAATQWAPLGLTRPPGRGVPPPPGAALPPLVGRAHEMALLERHLGAAGPPGLLVAGEPGIGKSRLLQELAGHAEAVGWTVLQGGCQRRGGHEPYAPVSSALQRYLNQCTEAHLRADLTGCAGLVRLLPELAAGPIEPLPAGTLSPEQERHLMVAAVVRVLANVAGPAGTLLLLDDLQWAGPDALDLLMALLRSAAEVPVRVIGAYRDAEVRPGGPLGILLADLAHAGLAAHHTLGPLEPTEVEDLLSGLLADAAAAQRALQQRVVERAGGVPFFLVSYARGLQAGLGAAMPWDLAQGLRQRVAALPAGGQTMLGVAAVVGRVVPRGLLAAVLAWPEDELLAALDTACAAQLLREEGIDTYHFPHDVIREVVEADLGATRRAVLHRRVAEALEDGPPAVTPPGDAPIERLAFHYAQAEAWPQALAYLMKAGDKAAAAYAHQAALAYYAQSLAACEKLGETALPVAAVAAQKEAAVLEQCGNYRAAVAGYERMRAIARRLGDRRLEGLALAYRTSVEVHDHAYDTAEQTARTALAIAEEGYPDVRLAASAGLVYHHVVIGRLAEAAGALRAAAEDAPQVQDPTIPRPEWWSFYLAYWAGCFDEALVEAERSRGAAANLDAMAWAWWEEALACASTGAYQRALALLDDARATWERTSRVPLEALNTLGWVYGEIEHHDRALAWNMCAAAAIQEGDLCDRVNNTLINLGDTLAALGRLDEAEEQFRRVEQAVRQPRPQDRRMSWRWAQHLFHSYGELWLARGDAARALAYADECLALAEPTGSRKNIVKGRRLRGQALLAQGQRVEADRELAQALAVARAIGNPPQLWKTLTALGDLRQAQSRPAAAHRAYREAVVVIEAVAQGLDDPELRATLLTSPSVRHIWHQAKRDADASLPAPAPPAPTEADPAPRLSRTARQAWVLEHVHTGGAISPRAYAAALGVSVDTALLDLRELVERGLLRAEGTTKDRRYRLRRGEGEDERQITALRRDSPKR